MVVRDDDLQAERIPNFSFSLKPRRKTIRWRGKRFNLPTVRVVKIGEVDSMEIERAL